MINTGDGFVDETQSRIENLRNEYNGHAEGHTYLIDFDSDGDLDIFDFQANVVDGYSVSNNNAPSEEDTLSILEMGRRFIFNIMEAEVCLC